MITVCSFEDASNICDMFCMVCGYQEGFELVLVFGSWVHPCVVSFGVLEED